VCSRIAVAPATVVIPAKEALSAMECLLEKLLAPRPLSKSRDFCPIWLSSDGVNLSIKRVKACDCPGNAEQIYGLFRLSNFGFDCGTFGSPTLPLPDRLAQIAEAKKGRKNRDEKGCHRPARGPPTLPSYNAVEPDGFHKAPGTPHNAVRRRRRLAWGSKQSAPDAFNGTDRAPHWFIFC
jgi:hypothetical protein